MKAKTPLTITLILIAMLVQCGQDDLTEPPYTVAISAGPTVGPAPLAVTFSAYVTGNVAEVTYLWDFGDDTTSAEPVPTHVYSEVGNYSIVLTTYDGSRERIATSTIVVAGGKVLDVGLSADPTEGSAPLTVRFAVSSDDFTTDNAVFEWDFGDGSRSFAYGPAHTYQEPGTYSASLLVTTPDERVGTASVTITVAQDNAPTASMVLFPDQDTAPFDIIFSGRASGGDGALTYRWEYGDGLTESGTVPPGGLFTSPNLCDLPACLADEECLVEGAVCLEGTCQVSCVEGGSSCAEGEVCVESLCRSGCHRYRRPGTVTVRLVVTDEDGDTAMDSREVTVLEDHLPRVAPTAQPAAGLAPLDVAFAPGLSGGNAPFTYLWDFGDGSEEEPSVSDLEGPGHVYGEAGTYMVTLTVTDGDGDVASGVLAVAVTKDQQPEALVRANDQTEEAIGQAPFMVDFLCSSPTGNEPLTYLWDFGDGTHSALMDPTHTYLVAASYHASCTIVDADGDQAVASIAIAVASDAIPVAKALAAPDEGMAPLNVQFFGTPTGGDEPLMVLWDFGDGATSEAQTASHTYEVPGTYVATFTVTDNDGSTATDAAVVTVRERQDIEIPELLVEAFASPLKVTSGDLVDFRSQAMGGMAPFTYTWDFGDSSTLSHVPDPTHRFMQDGAFEARVVVTDGQGSEASDSVTVQVTPIPPPLTLLDANVMASITQGEAPLRVNFRCEPSGGVGPLTFAWALGDGSSAAVDELDHTYTEAGRYRATCMVTDARGSAVSAQSPTIEVAARNVPQVFASASPSVQEVDLAIHFEAYTVGGSTPIRYTWNFGDGSTAEGRSADHIYRIPGSYMAVVTVEDADHDMDATSVSVLVVIP